MIWGLVLAVCFCALGIWGGVSATSWRDSRGWLIAGVFGGVACAVALTVAWFLIQDPR